MNPQRNHSETVNPGRGLLFGPKLTLVLCDIAALMASLLLAYQLRFDFAVPAATRQTFPLIFAWVIAFKIFCLWRFRRFEVLLGYFSISEASLLFWSLFVPGLFIFGVSNQFGSDFAPPRSVVLIDLGFSIIGLTAVRLHASMDILPHGHPPGSASPPRCPVIWQ